LRTHLGWAGYQLGERIQRVPEREFQGRSCAGRELEEHLQGHSVSSARFANLDDEELMQRGENLDQRCVLRVAKSLTASREVEITSMLRESRLA